MRKAITTILIFLTTVILMNAQKENRKWVAGINTGISVPYNSFAIKEMTYDAGFAGSGANIDIDFFRYAGKIFAFSLNVGYANVFFNEDAYLSGYEKIPYLDGETTVDAGNYHIFKGLLGITFKTPEIRHFEILLNLQMGYSLSVHPNIIVTNTELGVINSVEKCPGGSIMTTAGLKLNYNISEKYGLSLNYSRNYTEPGFNDDSSIDGGFFLPIFFQNINAGIVINL